MQHGAANYLGEMGGKELTRRDFVSDMKLTQTRYTGGAFARYKFNQYFALKGSANYIRLSGADSLSTNAPRNARNLSFRNDMIELNAQGQFVFYEVTDLGRSYMHKDFFRAYLGLGLGAVYHNPKTLYNGEWVALRPLTTEGQDKPYTKVTMVIPAAAGFHFTLNKHYRVGWEVCWRTAFSDYLDDVSTNYASPSQLPNATAIALANRTDEKPNLTTQFTNNFEPGNKRGDSEHNDSYLSSSIEMSYVITGRSAWGRGVAKRPGSRGNGPSKIRDPLHIRL